MNKFEYRRNDLDPSSNGLIPSRNDLDLSRNGLVPSHNGLDLSRNGLDSRRNGLVLSWNGLDLSRNGLVLRRNGLVPSHNGLDLTAKEADLGENEAKEGQNGANWGQIGVIERVPDRFLNGIGFQVRAVGLWLLILVWEDVLESSAKPFTDSVDGTGLDFFFAGPEPRQGIEVNIRLPRDGP